MLVGKDEILTALHAELEDREVQANESGSDYTDELKGLLNLINKVAVDQPLISSEYEWLAYIMVNYTLDNKEEA